jgi:hypothetical protein
MSNLFLTEDEFLKAVTEIKNTNNVNISYFSTLIDKVLFKQRIYSIVENYQLFELVGIIFSKVAESMEIGDPWKNSVDPLTFILGAAYSDSKTLKVYGKTEETRQKEKSVGSKFGYFHQGLLRLAFKDKRPIKELFKNAGKEFDVLSGDNSIAIEVKSKWNTTKGDTRTEKYKEMWGMRKAAKEIYFAEVLGQPKKNTSELTRLNLKDDSDSNSNNKIIFEKCNGEYIYQRAAKYNKLNLENENILKKIFENFPFVIWLYSKIYLIKIHQNLNLSNENKIDLLIKKSNAKMLDERDPDKLDILSLISCIGDREYENMLFENKSRKLKIEKKEARNLINQRDQLKGLCELTMSVSTRIENFFSNQDDLNFLNAELIGHLY